MSAHDRETAPTQDAPLEAAAGAPPRPGPAVRLIGPKGPRRRERKYVLVETGPPRRRGGRRTLAVLGLVWAAVIAGAAGYFVWQRKASPQPPAVALEGYDTAIVKAVTDARAGVLEAPHSAEAWGRLATVLYVHDIRAEADGCFARAESLDPQNPRWPYLRARSIETDNPDLAIPHLRRAVALVERGGDVPAAPRLLLAELLVHRGELDEAEAHFRRVAKRSPADARALLGLGRVALERDDLPAAREALTQSVRWAPRVKAGHVLLAAVQRRTGEHAEADRTLARVSRMGKEPDWPDPFSSDAYQLQTGLQASLSKARDLLDAGRPHDAATLMRRTTDLYPASDAAWLYLGRALVRQRELVPGEAALRTCVRLAPDSVEALVQLGIALYLQRNYVEAAARFSRAAQLKPELGEAHYNLGLALVAQEDLSGGAEELRTAVRLRPDLVDAYVALGAALVRLGQPGEGAEQFRRALRLTPGEPRATDLLRQLGVPVTRPTSTVPAQPAT